MARRPQPARELADSLPVSRPAVSQHLKVLQEAGLVTDRVDGTRRVYRVQPEGVAAMCDYLDRMWSTALDAFAAAVEQDPQQNSTEHNPEQHTEHLPEPPEGPES